MFSLSASSVAVIDHHIKDNLNAARERLAILKQSCPSVTIDFARKCINPYELIGHAQSTPRQRNFYGFLELVERVPALGHALQGRTLHLCEAPGNFIEAVLHLYPQADWHASSLNHSVPFFDHLQQAKKSNGHSRVMFGLQGSGDITKPDVLPFLERELGSDKATLVTCDGGVWLDDKDRNNQETLNSALFQAEIHVALACMALHGCLVVKLFDTFESTTHALVHALSVRFARGYIIKLDSGRITSSERYLVFEDYNGQPWRAEELDNYQMKNGTILHDSAVALAQQQTTAIIQTVQLATYLHAINVSTAVDARNMFLETLATCQTRLKAAQSFLARIDNLRIVQVL